ncbi:MAG TPA: hypothetical protein K8V15_09390 [Tessaracoccus flavescens]|uniref:ABC transporter substrate-binding protein n=1 Tax=Tessaracoccus flavescens TaxID=399497 RepID=A0A921ER07_9ACTN|nr:hypothetical protein [Tessaracoccus flavescens]
MLEGADPASTPVEIQESLELVVNEEAAKRMGVTLPAELVAKADKKY